MFKVRRVSKLVRIVGAIWSCRYQNEPPIVSCGDAEQPTRSKSGFRRPASFLSIALAFVLLCPITADRAQAYCIPGPGDRPETGLQGAVPFEERQPPLGFQGFWCGARKVGQHALFDRGSYGDTLQIRHCAYSSMRDPSDLNAPTTGTAVLDVKVPSQPEVVQILRTPAMIRAYSALEIQGNIMIGAFKDFGPNGTNPLDVYDVSGNCLEPVHLSTFNVASGNHDGWLTPDAKTYYGVPFGGDTIQQNPNRIDIHVTDLSDPTQPQHLLNWNRLQLPPEVQARTLATRNFHDASTNDDGTRLYLALYGGNNALGGFPADGSGRCANGLLILDSSEVALRRPNPQLHYVSFLSWCDQQIDPDFGDGSTAASHATEYVIHENGKEYIVTTDESGGGLSGTANGMCDQRTYARIIDISDETNPQVVGTFKPDVNKPENCERNLIEQTNGGMVHYIGFDDRYKMRLVFYAGADQGIRVVDFRDPENPKEIAYYVKERHSTTPVTDTDFTRPDPRYDAANCFIYTGWNQGGLVIIELTNPEYNPCMRRTTTGEGSLASSSGGKSKTRFAFDAKRTTDHGLKGELELKDHGADTKIHIEQITFLGSIRDQCGSVLPDENSVQFEGNGTYNGESASFRVCVQDNSERRARRKGAEADRFYLTCTGGCTYSTGDHVTGDAIDGGNIRVDQPDRKPNRP
jgi:hypothetical protein